MARTLEGCASNGRFLEPMNISPTVPRSVESAESDTRTRLTPLETSLVALLTTSALINYVDRQAIAVVSPLLKTEFHLSATQWGYVTSVFAISYVLTSALGGVWIDKIGVRKGLLISTIVWSLAAAGHALANNFLTLCFWRVMLALGEGPGGACQLKGVRRVCPPRLRDFGTGIIGAGTLLGALLAPLTVAPLAASIGWRAAFVVTSLLGAIWLPFWIMQSRRKEAGLGAPEEVSPEAAAVAGPRLLTSRSFGVWATAICIFFTIPPTVFTLAFFPLFLASTYGLDIKQSASYQWQPFLAMDLGQIVAGVLLMFLLRRGWAFLSARRLVMVSGFLGATTMILMNFAPDLAGTMIWLNFSRFCFQFAYVGLLAYGISIVADRETGRMNGFMNATFGACSAVFAPIIGQLSDHFDGNYKPIIWLVGLMPLVGLTGWLVLSRLHDRAVAQLES